MTLQELIREATLMLMGEEGIHFSYYGGDFKWWWDRLYMRRN